MAQGCTSSPAGRLAIVNRARLQAIPAVVVTALPMESDRIRASLRGAANYLAKAVELDEFAVLLKISLQPFI
jgi:CheY-like chemotaxis protein